MKDANRNEIVKTALEVNKAAREGALHSSLRDVADLEGELEADGIWEKQTFGGSRTAD